MNWWAKPRLAVLLSPIGLTLAAIAAIAWMQGHLWLGIAGSLGLLFVGVAWVMVSFWQARCKENYERLLAKEERYRDFIDQANDLIQIVAPDGKLLYVNRAWRKTLGYSEEEISELSLMEVITPESLPHCMEMFQRIMQGEVVEGVEAQFRAKDGRVVYVEGNASCRRDKDHPLNTRGIFRDITERKRAEEALRESEEKLRQALENEKEAARQDPLTKLANRRAFFEIAEMERHRSCRHARPVTVAYIDVDDFKKVNDMMGHASGDELLAQIAAVLRSNLRGCDTAARLGGDEFALLLTETDARGAETVLRNLQKLLAAAMQAGGWPVSFSMGAAVFPCCPDSVRQMVLSADQMMYRVKKSGKNDVLVMNIGKAECAKASAEALAATDLRG